MLGGALGVLVYTELWVGFTAVSAILILGLAQTVVSFRGNSLIPGLGGNRPVMVEQEGTRRDRGMTAAVPRVKRGVAVLLAAVVTLLARGRRGRHVAAGAPVRPAATRDQRVFARAPDPGGALPVLQRAQPRRLSARRRLRASCAVSERYPVQLSVPEAISRAPWRLLQVYEDPANTTSTMFRPGTRLAVTIPSVDPQRGRLTGIVVQLLTLVVDPAGELRDVPHAEWSVRLAYLSAQPDARALRAVTGRAPARPRRRPRRRSVSERPASQRFPAVRGQPAGQVRALGHDPVGLMSACTM